MPKLLQEPKLLESKPKLLEPKLQMPKLLEPKRPKGLQEPKLLELGWLLESGLLLVSKLPGLVQQLPKPKPIQYRSFGRMQPKPWLTGIRSTGIFSWGFP